MDDGQIIKLITNYYQMNLINQEIIIQCFHVDLVLNHRKKKLTKRHNFI